MSVDCLILGDSIAVGIGQDRPACLTVARVGVSSDTFVQTLLRTVPTQARSIVISLGVNDGASAATADTLRRMRGSVSAVRVTWLLPGPKEDVRRAIRTVAAEYGDRLIDTSGDLGPDHLHPTGAGYRRLAALTRDDDGPPSLPSAPVRTSVPVPVVHYAPVGRLPTIIYLSPPSYMQPLTRSRPVAMTWLPPSKIHPAPSAVHPVRPTAY